MFVFLPFGFLPLVRQTFIQSSAWRHLHIPFMQYTQRLSTFTKNGSYLWHNLTPYFQRIPCPLQDWQIYGCVDVGNVSLGV